MKVLLIAAVLALASHAAVAAPAARFGAAAGLPVDGPTTSPTPTPTTPDKLPTEPTPPPDADCNAATVDSLRSSTYFSEEAGTCMGTDCAGKNLSVPYVKETKSGQQFYSCRYSEHGIFNNGVTMVPANSYYWDEGCAIKDTASNACSPQIAACPKCKPTDPPRYWARPTIVAGPSTHDDQCKFQVSKSDALKRLMAKGREALDKAYAQQAERFDSGVRAVFNSGYAEASAMMCVATPIEVETKTLDRRRAVRPASP